MGVSEAVEGAPYYSVALEAPRPGRPHHRLGATVPLFVVRMVHTVRTMRSGPVTSVGTSVQLMAHERKQ